MKIKIFQNRKVDKDYFDNEGTSNENAATTLSFELPLGYEDFEKKIVFLTESGNFWDKISDDNTYTIKNNITIFEEVDAYVWLKKDEMDFRTEQFKLNFNSNENPDFLIPDEVDKEEIGSLVDVLNLKIKEVEDLKDDINDTLTQLKDYDTQLANVEKQVQDIADYQIKVIDQLKKEFEVKEFSGTNIHLTDSAELPILDLGINGGIEQDTREGYNELDTSQITETSTLNGVTRSYDKKTGIITLNGTGTADNSQLGLMPVGTERILNGEYTLFVEYISGTLSNETSNTNVQIQNSTTWYDGIVLALKNNSVLNARNRESFTANYYVIRYDTGVVFNNYKIRVMLIKGLYTLDTIPKFELYGSMPSLAFPSEVKGVSGDVEVKIQNKNLADMEVGGYSQTTGAKEYNPNLYRTKDFIKITNLEYIMTQENSQKIMRARVFLYDDEKNFISSEVFDNNIEIKNTNAKYFTIQGTLETFNYTLDGIQLEQGDVATDYVPHQEQLLPIDIPFNMYSGKPYKENGKWYRDVEYVKERLTSDMNWVGQTFNGVYRVRTNAFANIVKKISVLNTVRVYSNCFKQNYGTADYVFGNLKIGYLGFYTDSGLYITTPFTTLEEWNAYLNENEVYVVFEVETPTREEITDTTLIAQLEELQKAHSYYEVTNINSYGSEDVADLVLSGKYYVSNKARIENLEKAILSLGGNI